ncbi:uncharacterized protein LOC123696581 [Colias croceus]|uniref:uncharacterized protein LOC123696581 n=1 Tax=Colias crocea TaxID=72248 RepID=UPI001E280316|nr:uncharacterized protein LOC123696581 [Colias croceus]
MSLLKLLKAPSLLFKKDVITFVIIRRQDLGVMHERLRYIAVKPSASISMLRQKVWHLLDLPDYCDEIIKLKSQDGKELPLTELRKGNDPQHPYILEVWLPGNSHSSSTTFHNMITMGDSTILNRNTSSSGDFEENVHNDASAKSLVPGQALSNKTMPVNKIQDTGDNPPNLLHEYKPADMTVKLSTSSIFYKLHARKSRDNFTNILLKIQNDLVILSNKLSNLENKIHM